MNNTITIDEGEQKITEGKIVIKRRFTLSEEGDYETGTIKYHELFYDIDKSISALGEEENEKWKSGRRMLDNNIIESSKKWNQSMAAGANSLL